MIMSNNLSIITLIEQEKLNHEFYFESLLEQAHDKGILNNTDVERIQYRCLNLLAEKVERYNAGDSSSIRIEAAKSIMTSIFFTIGLALKTYPDPDMAATALKNVPISELYQKGRKRIDTMIIATKTVHAKLLHQLVDTQNVFYRNTLESGILGFFKLYSPDYSAHEIHITADYPLYNPIPQTAGIEFIKSYVAAAYYENLFCSYFASKNIHYLLSGYAKDYHDLLINIYEIVLTAAIGGIIAETDFYNLDINEAGERLLYQIFKKKAKRDILEIISEAAGKLSRHLQLSSGLMQYIQSSLPAVAGKIAAAAQGDTLNRVFISPALPHSNPQITFSFGEKMDDEEYRKIIDEIRQCRFSQDKVAIIKEHIHSLADLEDVLLDAALTEEEIQILLRELSLLEIAALSNKYLPIFNSNMFELREQEQLLCINLRRLISTLSPAQQIMVEQAGKAIG